MFFCLLFRSKKHEEKIPCTYLVEGEGGRLFRIFSRGTIYDWRFLIPPWQWVNEIQVSHQWRIIILELFGVTGLQYFWMFEDFKEFQEVVTIGYLASSRKHRQQLLALFTLGVAISHVPPRQTFQFTAVTMISASPISSTDIFTLYENIKLSVIYFGNDKRPK